MPSLTRWSQKAVLLRRQAALRPGQLAVPSQQPVVHWSLLPSKLLLSALSYSQLSSLQPSASGDWPPSCQLTLIFGSESPFSASSVVLCACHSSRDEKRIGPGPYSAYLRDIQVVGYGTVFGGLPLSFQRVSGSAPSIWSSRSSSVCHDPFGVRL